MNYKKKWKWNRRYKTKRKIKMQKQYTHLFKRMHILKYTLEFLSDSLPQDTTPQYICLLFLASSDRPGY